MLDETGISIFMFGNKLDKDTGNVIEADGCMQEFEIAKEKGNLIIPIGSTGYAAKHIYDDVKNNITDYPYLLSSIDALGSETDINHIIEIVIEIIKNQII